MYKAYTRSLGTPACIIVLGLVYFGWGFGGSGLRL